MSPRREGVRKGPAAETERDASQHAGGGIARGSFFPFIFLHQFIFFLLLCLHQSTQNDQTNIFSLSGNAPEAAFCPIFVLKNALGALFWNCFIERPGGRLLRSLR